MRQATKGQAVVLALTLMVNLNLFRLFNYISKYIAIAGIHPFSEEETIALNSVLGRYASQTDLFYSVTINFSQYDDIKHNFLF